MRIGIVNDLPLAVEAMRRVLVESGKHHVAWTAADGARAVELCRSDRPDLVLMDLIMPGMSGVEATRRIMTDSPCAILVVTATMEGNATPLFEAMGAGALDAVHTPALGGGAGPNGVAGFLYKIDSVARQLGAAEERTPLPRRIEASRLVAIGASAGGPVAVADLLRGLPADFPAAVVIVQHVDALFAPGLASWLREHCKLPVRPAAPGDPLTHGTVFLAATNDHLVMETPLRLGYTPEPADYSYRPSVNAFFESAARRWRGELIGVLLTGMGRDGATGLKTLRNLGHHTIAQDRATSAVYGMPKAAAELGAACEVLPLEQISATLCARFRAARPVPIS